LFAVALTSLLTVGRSADIATRRRHDEATTTSLVTTAAASS